MKTNTQQHKTITHTFPFVHGGIRPQAVFHIKGYCRLHFTQYHFFRQYDCSMYHSICHTGRFTSTVKWCIVANCSDGKIWLVSDTSTNATVNVHSYLPFKSYEQQQYCNWESALLCSFLDTCKLTHCVKLDILWQLFPKQTQAVKNTQHWSTTTIKIEAHLRKHENQLLENKLNFIFKKSTSELNVINYPSLFSCSEWTRFMLLWMVLKGHTQENS